MKKPPFWASFLTLCAVIILCFLGIWQLQRLDWKKEILANIERQSQNPEYDFNIEDLKRENIYAHGRVQGYFLHDKFLKLGLRTRDGTPGYHIIVPLRLQNETFLLVNRGWAPLDYKPDFQLLQNRNKILLSGIIRTFPVPNMMTPKNDALKDIWYRIDTDEIASAKNLKNILPVMLYETNIVSGSSDVTYPDAGVLKTDISNNHLQYALFWFTMAGVLIIVFVLRFIFPRIR